MPQANAKLTAGVAAFCLAASVFAGNDLAALPERPTGELQEKAQVADTAVDGCADVRVSQDIVTVTSTGAVSFVRLKMGEALASEAKVLNDAWERSYGDLKWQTIGEKTIYSPWYFLAEKDGKVQGFGVETGKIWGKIWGDTPPRCEFLMV